MDIKTTVFRHQKLVVDIILESPDREIISKLNDAFNARRS